jgi:hypothetical protein
MPAVNAWVRALARFQWEGEAGVGLHPMNLVLSPVEQPLVLVRETVTAPHSEPHKSAL